MSDFIAANLHKKVDALMDRFYGAGVASHPTIIEQINYLLFMRALSFKDDEYRQLGITDEDKIVFDGDLEKYRWENLLTLNAEDLFIALEDCFRQIPDSTTNKTVRLVFRNAHIKLYDKPSLRLVVHEIDAFAKAMDAGEHEGKRDVFGDTYEYLLSKLAQAGTSGQFRTPRHIIDFLVAVVAPQKGETILDPAVGTAGFLVKAFEYMRGIYTSPEVAATGGSFDKLSPKELSVLYEHTFNGFDSDEDMIKFGMMNLYLHGLENAQLIRQNTLTDTAGNRDKYDVILANPPFSGKIDRDSVAQELQMNTGATEVLFLKYILEHLKDNGRAGIIVPEGVLFNSSGGHSKIRKLLIDNGLWCVVSLPGGVFNPYAGVKTSILFIDKEIAIKKQFDRIMFVDINSDGFSLSTQRRPTSHNDLPNALVLIKEAYKEIKAGNVDHSTQHYFPFQDPDSTISVAPLHYDFELIHRDDVSSSSTHSLNSENYRKAAVNIDHRYPVIKLGELVTIVGGGTPAKSELSYYDGKIKWATVRDLASRFIDDTEFHINEDAIKASSTNIIPANNIIIATRVGLGKVSWINHDTAINQDLKALIVKDENTILKPYLMQIMISLSAKIIANGSGATVKGVTLDFIKSLDIPVPPIELQQKIVDEIKNKQDAIDHAREIIKSLERERAYFDLRAKAQKERWPILSFEDIASLEYGKPLPLGSRSPGHVSVMGSNGITGTHNKSLLTPPGIVIGRKGSAGLVTWVDNDFWPIDTTYFVKLKSNTNMSLRYLFVILLSSKLDSLRSGAGVPGLNRNDVYNQVKIPVPPIDTQNQIVEEYNLERAIIDHNKKLIDLYEQKISDEILL
jgi:type I restriction enzyme M protein